LSIFILFLIMPVFARDIFSELNLLCKNALPLIEDNNDKVDICTAIELINKFYKKGKTEVLLSERQNFDIYKYDDFELKTAFADGAYKGAAGHHVTAIFYYKKNYRLISFYICDDDCDLIINIADGGKHHFYQFNTKENFVKLTEYYLY
ncbi:hypothetical protein J5751_02890, partial [bacterium]|nr:hypothetical protein [bacterium]